MTSLVALAWPFRLEFLTWWQVLLLLAGFAVPVVLLGMNALAGLGPVRKWVAIGARLVVILVLLLTLGGLRWQSVNKDVEVLVLRDISQSTMNVTGFPGESLTTAVNKYLLDAADPKTKPKDDRIGVLSFNTQASIDAIPNTTLSLAGAGIREPGKGTDAAAAIQLGLAMMSKDAMHRMVLLWDGNATTGDLTAAVSAAAARKIPIDVMPLSYDVKNEVLVERFIAPSWKRENEPFTIDVILRSTNALATSGKLTLLHQGEPMDLDPTTPGVQGTRMITLQPGRNVEHVQVPPLKDTGVHQFRAVFEGENVTIEGQPDGTVAGGNGAKAGASDTLYQNNTADTFTFVRGKGKVLYIDNVAGGLGQYLRTALEGEGITLDATRTSPTDFPKSLVEMQNYDAVILANVPRGLGGLDEDQQKLLASYVHDLGGGLVMIGGPEAFGAGGWAGSQLEQVLPVTMDIPAQRQIPKGALVMIMHSCEMPDGNYWGEQCALKAAETLSPRDEIGVISLDWSQGSANWDYRLGEKGDGVKVNAAIKNMKLGDYTSFEDSFELALNGGGGTTGLLDSDARQKHMIIISDGDPQRPAQRLIDLCVQNKISVSTISVYPHDLSDKGLPPTMRQIADLTKGRAYGPINGNFSQLPQIFIKEATVVRRSLLNEDAKGIAAKLSASSGALIKGMDSFPPVYGLVLTGRKQSPLIDMPLVAGPNNDPLLAQWQTGLGKAAVFTSDAHNKWAAQWVGSSEYSKFWAQIVRSVSRPPMSSDFDVRTTQEDGKGRIEVEASNKDGGFLNFLSINGQVVGPDMKPREVRYVQTGPGTYVGEFDAGEPGNYVAVMNYRGGGGAGGGSVGGTMLTGLAVNSSPELRDLKSNESVLRQVAERTGGRMLPPFNAAAADMFARAGVAPSVSLQPIWHILIPIALALFIIDVSIRRIAWDWLATKRTAFAMAEKARGFMVVKKVETRQSLDALKGIRDKTAEQQAQVAANPMQPPKPVPQAANPTARFEAGTGVQGDITSVVGGATDKPLGAAPKKPEPKGLQPESGDAMGGLMAAKRRAQQKIKDQEEGKSPPQ